MFSLWGPLQSLGLLGGGGSILAVPILVYVMDVGAKSAIAISLVSVGTVSMIGSLLHWQRGNVRFDIALIFAPAAMVGSYLGALIASFYWITETFQLFCFGLVMLLASLLMITKSKQQSKTTSGLNSSQLASHKSYLHQCAVLAEGLGIGMLTGFVGIGGGFAIVPALVLLTGIPIEQAVGTSLLIISLKSVTGFLGYLGQIDIRWSLIISFTLAASAGTLFGSYLNRFVNAKTLQAGFGYFVLLFAVFTLLAQFVPT